MHRGEVASAVLCAREVGRPVRALKNRGMELTNTFTVPVPVAEAWDALLDIERVAHCVPGATLESVDGDAFAGNVRVKLGPLQLTYRGQARFVERDEESRQAVIEAAGKETKGAGTAKATVRTTLRQVGDQTEVHVLTELAVTGRPAQFGRGVMQDVSARLLDQFAQCLAEQLSSLPDGAADEQVQASTSAPATSAPQVAAAEPVTGSAGSEASINLLAVVGAPVIKRLALPLLLIAAAAVVISLVV